jgi:hypothetical protein
MKIKEPENENVSFCVRAIRANSCTLNEILMTCDMCFFF